VLRAAERTPEALAGEVIDDLVNRGILPPTP
jgi:hypothetical protein